MAVDYDAPRTTSNDESDDGLDVLTIRRGRDRDGDPDTDEPGGSAGLDFVDEELSVPVVPMRRDEFRCGHCFLVHHRSRLADIGGVQVCRDCS